VSKPIITILGFFLFGLLSFLSSAPLNQSCAVGVGESCRYGTNTTDVNCNPGFYCNVDADRTGECEVGKVCRGFCTKDCTVRESDIGSNNTNACGDPNLSCKTTSCLGKTCTGYCILDSTPRYKAGQSCTVDTASENFQGNCENGLMCVTNTFKSCQGKCPGVCFPNAGHTCRQEYDSRTNLQQVSCPGGWTCAEATGKTPKEVCQSQTCGKGGCACTKKAVTCPGCTWTCRPNEQVQMTCTCTNRPGKNVGSGNNGFTCSSPLLGQDGAYCNSANLGCYDDDKSATMTHKDVFAGATLRGIQCMTPEKKNPPAAPCNKMVNGVCTEILTAFGNVGTDPGAFITRFFGILLAASGGIALLLIMRAGYRIMTARGNPEGIKEGREQLVAAIVGLLFLIFSFVLLQVIGVDLLRLPNSIGSGLGVGATCDVNNSKCATGLVCNYNGAQGQCQKPK
jgi:hypothetical protein